MKIRVASRDSALAVTQSNMVIDCMKKHHPELEIELITMKTTGDLILDKTLDKIGGKGLFVKELDLALEQNRADISIHSFKDMPMDLPDELPIVAVSAREDARDVLILPSNVTALDITKPIGSSSQRRTLQLKQLFPNYEIKPIRGNLQTRLSKLDSGEYCALVLAYAGIKRLGLEHRVSRIFEIGEILPAACQGILAVQARADFNKQLLTEFNDEQSSLIANAERAFVRTLNGGCSSPVAAHCIITNNQLNLTGLYVDTQNKMHFKSINCALDDGIKAAEKLALEMKMECAL